MANDVKMLGLEDLGSTVNMLSDLVQKRVVRNATRAGARVYRDGMKSRAPKASGDLEAAITIKDYPLRTEGSYIALIGAKYTKKVAASSRKKTKKGKAAAPSSEDPGVYEKWVELGRPGATGDTHQAAQPFMRPTFDADTPKAEDAFVARAKEDLAKYLK